MHAPISIRPRAPRQKRFQKDKRMAYQHQERDPQHGAAQHEGDLRAADDLRGAPVERRHLFDEQRILLIIVFDVFFPHASEGKFTIVLL